ncbi:hypothetical protein GCM10010172_65590 [Paractinoplanes ferrugineus]|uniref:HEXXH motif-containing protein n=1 Tax=Paractinoplanes ferrugineus TaxID=113564 RepID=A0A919J3I5_9ACTN|nr:HEXXH motif-containing putative peptide modification protein [Actinoplanes ferrugineus]GIE13280.1 hypothetical protein Afe05nite_51200 [Actinoplanes ferrugineus]
MSGIAVNTSASRFDLPSELAERVDAYRCERLARLAEILDRIPGSDRYPWGGPAAAESALCYALAHHVFEGVSRAAQHGDVAAVTRSLALRTDQQALRPVRTESGTMVVVRPDRAAFVDDPALATSPVVILTPELATSTGDGDELVRRARDIAVTAGFGSTMRRNSRVVVLFAERRPTDDNVRSWTTTALPATVHLDYFAEPGYVARDLIHEAAHSELNDLFAAYGVDLPADVSYYAPWLDTHRPVFGFLHGNWAFSHVALFCRWLSETGPSPEVRAFAGAMYLKHAEQLATARADLDRALRLLPVPPLAELIARYRDEVLEGVTAGSTPS